MLRQILEHAVHAVIEEVAMADLIDELLRRWRWRVGSDHRSRQEASARAPKREEGFGAPTRDSLAELLRVDDTRSPRPWLSFESPSYRSLDGSALDPPSTDPSACLAKHVTDGVASGHLLSLSMEYT